jgi:uroporphyrinogen III methyltransferase / synthase
LRSLRRLLVSKIRARRRQNVEETVVVTVYLVGAGPGDPGLLTVRGADVLGRADVVVYDRLVHPSLLDLAPSGAERVYVGKAPGAAEMDQGDINALLVERGRAGQAVVRLKGGDPFVFGRGGEEAEALAAARVPFEVVPGITSAIGAPAYAGIPVTHRGASTHFTVVTGHEDPAKGADQVDWNALAKSGGTLVILMGAGRVGEIGARLVAGGLPPETPVAAVRNGTRADQETVRATLATVGDAGVKAPAAIVVGEVAGLDLSWFESRPLFGRAIVVTRAREQASELRHRLEGLGAEVIELPAIAIEPVDFEVPELDGYGWLVFTSANGVTAFFDRGIGPLGLDARAIAGVRIAAIGPRTSGALADRGLRPDLVPERFVAESLLDAFPPPVADGERVLLARAERARDVLPAGLSERGYEVDVLAVYRTVSAQTDPDTVDRVRRGGVDALTFTSSSTVTNFCDLLGAIPDPQPLVASIGPVTSKTAKERGLRVDVEAAEHTIDGLVDAVLERLSPT